MIFQFLTILTVHTKFEYFTLCLCMTTHFNAKTIYFRLKVSPMYYLLCNLIKYIFRSYQNQYKTDRKDPTRKFQPFAYSNAISGESIVVIDLISFYKS